MAAPKKTKDLAKNTVPAPKNTAPKKTAPKRPVTLVSSMSERISRRTKKVNKDDGVKDKVNEQDIINKLFDDDLMKTPVTKKL